MRKLATAAIIWLTSAGVPKAAEQGAESDRCKDAISSIVAETGTSFDHVSPSGNNVFLHHPAANEFSLDCSPYGRLAIFLSAHSAFPEPLFYALAAQAGAIVTHQSSAKLKAAALQCHSKALKSKDEDADLKVGDVAVECTAFMRDGGGTTISIASQPD